jgi:histidine triad (HIT) family protein
MSCIFCMIIDGSIPSDFRYESDRVVAFNDLTPQAPTHILIVPKTHHENAAATALADPGDIAEIFEVAGKLAAEASLDGYRTTFNTGSSAGQSVFHTHLHLLGGRAFAWPPG